MSVDFTEKAIELFKRGAAFDEKKEYEDAYHWYMESIEVFMTAIKYERKNPAKKTLLKNKVREIMERAEKIKEYLDNANGAGATSQKSALNKGDDDDDSKDKQRLRKGLSGAIVRMKPNVSWSQIAGLEGAKEALKEAVILPLRFPQLFTGNRKPWKGILMYGPPGTGKSYLAKAVATEGDGTFLSVSSADLLSRWLGESEKLVRNVFEMAREAYREEGKPAIIFIDEIDSLCSSRSDGENDSTRRVKTEFLVQMQGVGHEDEGVLVLGATNTPWDLDSAVRRRFERRIYIPLPEVQARCQMFKIHLGDTPNNLCENDWYELGKMTEGYSGSDINIVVRNAMMESVRTVQVATHFKRVRGPDLLDPTRMVDDRLVPCSPGDPAGFPMTAQELEHPELLMSLPVTMQDFVKALRTARPSVSETDVVQHIKFTEEFGQEG
ncbi:putative vacuolar protein sorting-associated protein 4 [Trypanosoma grayi]|uniref:putative vacuolar protein sorting-associated protein 4 n=1 Tax=Trypanosoma grayi TaxID=71804 RepID=UPI0004F44A7D|nr:putative vacuolar protein sorting-associated protein 4 [Trypanosoma grayi]KEG14058.1 putative vacuolar protein sorting-associated protein 4 [Trypanosoma grayi]